MSPAERAQGPQPTVPLASGHFFGEAVILRAFELVQLRRQRNQPLAEQLAGQPVAQAFEMPDAQEAGPTTQGGLQVAPVEPLQRRQVAALGDGLGHRRAVPDAWRPDRRPRGLEDFRNVHQDRVAQRARAPLPRRVARVPDSTRAPHPMHPPRP